MKSASNAYTSLAATADGRRLVVTEAQPTASLWRVQSDRRDRRPRGRHADSHSHAARRSPRLGPDSLLYRAPKAGTDAIWKHEGPADARELWSGQEGRVIDGPALSADGRRIAFTVQSRGKTWLYVMNSDGSGARSVAQELDVRGAPAWSPDGKWIAIAALHAGEPRLFKIPDSAGPADCARRMSTRSIPCGRRRGDSSCTPRPTWARSSKCARSAPMASRTCIPKLSLSRGSRRLAFLGADDDTLVILKGALSHKEFWAVDLRSGVERALTHLGPVSSSAISMSRRTAADRVRSRARGVGYRADRAGERLRMSARAHCIQCRCGP